MSEPDLQHLLDELRRHRDEPARLADAARLLRDRDVLAGEDVAQGLADLAAGRVHRLDEALLEELFPPENTR